MNDFRNIYNQMRQHRMQLPNNRVQLNIPDPHTTLENYFEKFLALENTTFQWQPEYDQIGTWLADNQGRGLFLYGDCGRGKSILTRYVLPAILLQYAQKVTCIYSTQEMNAKLDEVLTKHIIALDDIGTEEAVNNYGNKRLAFAEIIDAAEKQGKLLIISSNLSREQIAPIYGIRTYERIISTTKRIQFEGKSLRK